MFVGLCFLRVVGFRRIFNRDEDKFTLLCVFDSKLVRQRHQAVYRESSLVTERTSLQALRNDCLVPLEEGEVLR